MGRHSDRTRLPVDAPSGSAKTPRFRQPGPTRKSSRPGAVTISVGSRADSDTFYREDLTRSSGEGPGCGVKDQMMSSFYAARPLPDLAGVLLGSCPAAQEAITTYLSVTDCAVMTGAWVGPFW